ncbi:hypothetical protein [Chryseobacterium polytrichastri]|uniref:Uncharacterized protein n=1 Tax=Chryseobacterium polytrichastri TaxID=1302687 RepID=A0A1M7CHK3_9FLAO|nr:hypothetical protein [Chryseobacterium polytrichastri]SHL66680.1 hypothetical protein SAMN05444267_102231 [Chryseobacterium polytrichastri]
MELDFRKLDVIKLFDFSKEEEKLIFEIYDKLIESYSISVINIEDSPYNQFISKSENPLIIPKICYYITNKNNTTGFYLFIINKIETTVKGARTNNKFDTLQCLGFKKLDEDFNFISINKKKFADKIAGIFSSFNINFKDDRDFKDFYVLGSDKYKTMEFLNPTRKEIIKSFPDEDFHLEIKNDILSFAIPKKLTLNNALIISNFLKQI